MILLILFAITFRNAPPFDAGPIAVFRAGEDGYHTFRIPAVVRAPSGALLAFAEGRKSGRADSGDIDLVAKRSEDDGRSWSPLQVVLDDGPNTAGNPCLVVERKSGAILLIFTRNLGGDNESEILDGKSEGTRTVWLTRSVDDGASWSVPVELTDSVKSPSWTWVATGPGAAIQLESGRLVVPCDHFEAGTKRAGSHAMLSDDAGTTWRLGGSVEGRLNECQVAELADGRLLLSMRNHPALTGEGRAWATSDDGGQTWSEPFRTPKVPDPGCQASLLRVGGGPGEPDPALLFANPAGGGRTGMTVRRSDDGGQTWPKARSIDPGPAAYSCLVDLGGEQVGLLFERGKDGPYDEIVWVAFPSDLE